MKLIIIVDNNLGISFNHRRQSRDSELINHLSSIVKDTPIYMGPLSGILFATHFITPMITDSLLEQASENDYVLVEDKSVKDYANKFNEILLYRWNRDYPHDIEFDIDVSKAPWKITDRYDFAGSSHDNITFERYIKS